MRIIYGPVYDVDLGIFERRKNDILQSLYNKLNICYFFSSKRLKWAGYVWRAEGCLIRKVLTGKPSGKETTSKMDRRGE